MTPEQFQEQFMNRNSVNLPRDAVVHTGDDLVEDKYVYRDTVYRHEDQLFMVTTCRTNSGYWSDCEWEEPTVYEVGPYQHTETRYQVK